MESQGRSAPIRYLKGKMPLLAMALRSAINHAKALKSRLRLRRMLRERAELFLEVGAGNKRGEGKWLTIDMTENCDIFWDLRHGLPFPSGRVAKIYSSHFLEHLSFRDGQRFLDECRRVLEPGGVFSICVPNARLYLEAYFQMGTLNVDKACGWRPACNNTTRIDLVNYIAYMDGEHKYMFDPDNLLFILKARGFRNVHLRNFDPSLDSAERDFESIYAEAEK